MNEKSLDWYVKWVASISLLIGMLIRGIEGLQIYDLTFSTAGITLWLWVSILWKDRALIIVNTVGVLLLLRNVFQTITG